jgi:hypothetical protein
MSRPGLLERLDDRLNPIVVKELRQAVQGRFVTVVLLLFLFVQLVVLGLYLLLNEVGARPDDLEAQHGRAAFTILQAILLGTCMIFLPLYAGVRLGAERSDTNVDLLFISTLRPRAIISGKLWAALVLALVIFSACAPFMTFTYLLRGLDLFSILLVLGIDFAAVVVAVQMAIFLASVPGHWLIKALIGLIGLGALIIICTYTVIGTVALLSFFSVSSLADSLNFWVVLSCCVAGGVTATGLFFTWSVALISPPSANRALPSRLFLLAAWLGSGAVFVGWQVLAPEWYDLVSVWAIGMAGLCCLQVIIAINEREQWTPRVGRTIPGPWPLRVPAFLVYSGAAGGLTFAVLLFVATWLGAGGAVRLRYDALEPPGAYGVVISRVYQHYQTVFAILWMIGLYTWAYAMTAVLLRRLSGRRVRVVDTWILMIFLVAIGSALPLLLSVAFLGRTPDFYRQYYWYLTNPGSAAVAAGEPPGMGPVNAFAWFVTVWALLVTAVNALWYVRQVLRFRPYVSVASVVKAPPVPVTAAEMDTTRTAT